MPYVAVAAQAVVAWLIGYKLPLSITSKRYQKDGDLPVWPFWNRPGHCATRGRGLPPEVRPLPVALSAYPIPGVS